MFQTFRNKFDFWLFVFSFTVSVVAAILKNCLNYLGTEKAHYASAYADGISYGAGCIILWFGVDVLMRIARAMANAGEKVQE